MRRILSSNLGIVALVLEGQLDIAVGGFDPNELVLMEIVVGGGIPNVILRSGFANDVGAFMSSNAKLPAFMQPGIYTIAASTLGGRVASAPLVVCEAVDGKCQ